MRQIFFSLLIVLFYLSSHAQIQALTSDVTIQNGVVYFNNKPFTGTLYSDDDAVIPNDCECTIMEQYKNGLKDGWQYAFYPNGKKKYEGEYKNGKPVGLHVFYDKNGHITIKKWYNASGETREEHYNNGKLSLLIISENDQPKEVKHFDQNGKLISHTIYKTPGDYTVITYEDGYKKSEVSYKNDQLHGTKIIYGPDGQKVYTETYQNGRLIEKGGWKNGQKDGWWTYTKEDETLMIRYENGEKVEQKSLKPQFRIDHFSFQPGDHLLKFKHRNSGATEFTVVRGLRDAGYKDEKTAAIEKRLVRLLLSRAEEVNPDEYPEDYISKIIDIPSIEYKTTPITYEVTQKDKDGNAYKVKKRGYETEITYTIEVWKTGSTRPLPHEYKVTSSGGALSSALQSITKDYPSTPDEAFARAYKYVSPYFTISRVYPYYTKIVEVVKKTKNKIKQVTIDLPNVPKGVEFAYYLPGEYRPKVVLKVIRGFGSGSTAKVVKGGDWLYTNNKIKEIYFKEY